MYKQDDLPLAMGHPELRRFLPSLGLPARRKLLEELGVKIAGRCLVPTHKILALLQAESGEANKVA